MASMRDIKRRKSSIQSTQQITKAMKLVSTVKLQKARTHAEQSRPYTEFMYETVASMLAGSGDISHPLLKAGNSSKKAVIVITSNRGLAGGYNMNVVKLLQENGLQPEDLVVYAIGKKGKDMLERRGYQIIDDKSEIINQPLYQDAAAMSKEVLDGFTKGGYGEIYLAYTSFKNTVVHEPKLIRLLPFDGESAKKQGSLALMNYEPGEEEALGIIIPKYISSLIYGALLEAVASENGARMQAMDAATSNAEDMIDDLSLKFNRARQGSITQELTEIIAGAEAIN